MPRTCLLRRPQYSVIGRDVKQAVRLLEMSLSGLMSAETALNIWRDEIPSKVRKEFCAGCRHKPCRHRGVLARGLILPVCFCAQSRAASVVLIPDSCW